MPAPGAAGMMHGAGKLACRGQPLRSKSWLHNGNVTAMLLVVIAAAVLVVVTGFIHYEVLRGLSARLPSFSVPDRAKLLVVIAVAFIAHAVEILLYGAAFYVLVAHGSGGGLVGVAGSLLAESFYFSAATYTTLGFGDVTPNGPIRLLAGVEAMNGLLLISWTASFTYLSMEKFWEARGGVGGA